MCSGKAIPSLTIWEKEDRYKWHEEMWINRSYLSRIEKRALMKLYHEFIRRIGDNELSSYITSEFIQYSDKVIA